MLSFHARALAAAIAAGVIAGLATAAASGAVAAGWVAVAVVAVFAGALARGAVRRRRITYTVTDRRLRIEVGLVARDVRETRLEQIQNVSSSQTLLERLLDVGTVAFDTAGGVGFDFRFAGVAQPRRIARTVDDALHQRLLAGRA
jgi:uncharacterized membrane protein YdbT with pleckstrin-like domain